MSMKPLEKLMKVELVIFRLPSDPQENTHAKVRPQRKPPCSFILKLNPNAGDPPETTFFKKKQEQQ